MLTGNELRRKKIPAVIVSLMMFLTVFAVLPATDFGNVYAAGETGQVTASLLYVRAGAGTSYSKIGSLKKGKTFTVTGSAKDKSGVTWYKMNYNSRNGYVSSKYVNIKQATVTSLSNTKGTVTTQKDPLIVRSGPGKGYTKLGTLAKGKTFIVTGKTTDSSGAVWYVFSFNGKTGYVSSSYVKIESTSAPITELKNTKGTVATKSDPLTIRSGAGTNFSKLGTLAKGKTFDITGETKDSTGLVWYIFNFNGKTGYASSKYVTVTKTEVTETTPEETTPDIDVPEDSTSDTDNKEEAEPEETTPEEAAPAKGLVTTQKDPLIIRKGPSKTTDNLGTIPKGASFDILDTVKDSSGLNWYKLTYNGKTGYVSGLYVTVIDSSSSDSSNSDIKAEPVTFKLGTITTQSTGLNVRSGAGTGYSILTVLAKGSAVTITGQAKASNGKVWYTYQYSSNKTGYICSDYVTVKTVTSDSEFEAYMIAQGFPDSYKAGLRTLHAVHPNWVFKAVKVGYDWQDAVDKETPLGKNVVSSSSPVSYRNSASYNSSTKQWNTFDGGWYAASPTVIAHYMDPRNFLNESGIYQFMIHTYDGSTQNADTVKAVVKGTFLASRNPGSGYTSYASLIADAGKEAGVNPNVLAAMIIQEQGTNGSSGLISGSSGYYNFFNVGAYHGDGMTAVQRGLWYARGCDKGETSYSRPWNSPYKSIVGGAKFYATGYVYQNQDSYYSKKFNVYNGLGNVGTHQYMSFVAAASSEGSLLKKAYADNPNCPATFEIPVYNNMPASTCPLP